MMLLRITKGWIEYQAEEKDSTGQKNSNFMFNCILCNDQRCIKKVLR